MPSYYYSETSFQLSESSDPPFAVGAIRDIVPLLPVGHYLQDPLGIECTLGDHTTDQEMHLGQCQARGSFFNRHCSRTKKK